MLKATGPRFEEWVFELNSCMIESEAEPIESKHGNPGDVWKSKSNLVECDKKRDLLLFDHSAKAYTCILKDNVIDSFKAKNRTSQFVGINGGSIDIPHHMITCAIEHPKMHSLCIFVLFVDLEKAFDKVVREWVF